MNILTTHSGKGPDDKVGIPDFGFRGPNTNTLFQSGFPLYAKKKRQCVTYREKQPRQTTEKEQIGRYKSILIPSAA